MFRKVSGRHIKNNSIVSLSFGQRQNYFASYLLMWYLLCIICGFFIFLALLRNKNDTALIKVIAFTTRYMLSFLSPGRVSRLEVQELELF